MRYILYISNFLAKGLFAFILAKILESVDFVTIMKIIMIQEGFSAFTSSALNVYILRYFKDTDVEAVTLYFSVSIITLIGFLVVYFIFDVSIFELIASFLLFILKLPFFIKSKTLAINNEILKSFKIVFQSDTLPLVFISCMLIFIKQWDQIIILMLSTQLIILLRFTPFSFSCNLSSIIIKEFISVFSKVSAYGLGLGYWFTAERLILTGFSSDIDFIAFLFITLRLATLFTSLFFGYYSTISYPIITKENSLLRQKQLIYSIYIFIGMLCVGSFFASFPFKLFIELFFIEYVHYYDIWLVLVIGIYSLLFNFLTFIFIFIEKLGRVAIMNLVVFIMYASLFLYDWFISDEFIFYHFLSFMFLIVNFFILIYVVKLLNNTSSIGVSHEG